MFGFQGGESAKTLARKRVYMAEAQAKWPFLTSYDLSTIKNEAQFRTLIRDRMSLSQDDAAKVVSAWILGRDFTSTRPEPTMRSPLSLPHAFHILMTIGSTAFVIALLIGVLHASDF